jgi:hypothetical protein
LEPKLLGYFFYGKSYVLILTKNALGYILGESFTNSSGHPGVEYHDGQTNMLGRSFERVDEDLYSNASASA